MIIMCKITLSKGKHDDDTYVNAHSLDHKTKCVLSIYQLRRVVETTVGKSVPLDGIQ